MGPGGSIVSVIDPYATKDLAILIAEIALPALAVALLARAAGRAMNDEYCTFHQNYSNAMRKWDSGHKVSLL